jgi:hypothetical protein
MYNYQKNSLHEEAAREHAVYTKMVAQYQQLLTASDEGVFEVTVRTQSGSIAVAMSLNDGNGIAASVADVLGKRIDVLERRLNGTLSDIGADTEEQFLKLMEKEAQQQAAMQQRKAQYVAVVEGLSATAASPAPTYSPQEPVKPQRQATRRVAAMPVPQNALTQPQPQG